MNFKVGIIGCGMIGEKRAANLGTGVLIACSDKKIERAQIVARKFGKNKNDILVTTHWKDLLKLPELDIVVVSTLHDSLAEITLEAVKQGKHVLVEKPAARKSSELLPIIDYLKNPKFVSLTLVRVGFNHRYHKALIKSKELIDDGSLGDLMFIRARYGHGGRIGYDKEWRANPDLSGGGELIDQGPHLIDLARYFLGDFIDVQGFAHTYYWDMPVDDNGFMMLKTKNQQMAFLHVSCTEWKNLFSMEIYGKNGKLEINGLGGSYGVEKLTYYKMLPEMGPPETYSWEYPMADKSWFLEMDEFYKDISLKRNPSANIFDAYEALKIIEKIYKESGYDYSS